jgi:uncharacterized protein YdcH (DUF465 family)
MTADERFARIEKKHEELSEIVARIGESHIELEAAQLNQQRVHTRLEEVVTNLTILVDTLIKRDLNRGSN